MHTRGLMLNGIMVLKWYYVKTKRKKILREKLLRNSCIKYFFVRDENKRVRNCANVCKLRSHLSE